MSIILAFTTEHIEAAGHFDVDEGRSFSEMKYMGNDIWHPATDSTQLRSIRRLKYPKKTAKNPSFMVGRIIKLTSLTLLLGARKCMQLALLNFTLCTARVAA